MKKIPALNDKRLRFFLYGKHRLVIVLLVSVLFGEVVFLLFLGNVNTEEQEAARIYEKCKNTQKRNPCYADEFKLLGKSNDIEVNKKILIYLQKRDAITVDCHLIAHVLSRAETLKDPSGWKELLITQNPAVCLGGFIHGIIEEYVALSGRSVTDVHLLNEICTVTDKPEVVKNCYHVMGHLILVDVADDTTGAISVCNQLSQFAKECAAGVFMEHVTRLNLIEHGFYNSPKIINAQSIEELKLLCDEMEPVGEVACWGEMGVMFSKFYKDDLVTIYGKCKEAPRNELISSCNEFASAMALIDKPISKDRIDEICNYFHTNNERKACYLLIVSQILFMSEKFSATAIEFCASTDVPVQEECFQEISKYYDAYNFNNAELKNKDVCNQVKAHYKSTCLKFL